MSNAPRRPSVERLVDHCFTTAVTYLRLQKADGLRLCMHDASDDPVDGLALQVMARLFERDGHERFSYFRERIEALVGKRRRSLRSCLRRAVIAETDRVILDAYRARQPLAPVLEQTLSARAGELEIEAVSSGLHSTEGAGRPSRPHMPQHLLQWHVEQHLEADSLDTFLETVAAQLCQQTTLYRPAWAPPRVALALHSFAVDRVNGELTDWPAPLLVVVDTALYVAAHEVLSLEGSLSFEPPGGSPAGAAEELAGRLRQIWPHLRDGHAEVPALAALAPATVARLTRRAEQLLKGKL